MYILSLHYKYGLDNCKVQTLLCSGFLPPMFLHTSAQSDLLSDLCADRVGKDDLGQISLDGADAATCRQRADVHHQHLVLRQLLDLQKHRDKTCCHDTVHTPSPNNQRPLNALKINA